MTDVLSPGAGMRPCGLPAGNSAMFEAAMKTQGEVEAAICEGMTRFE
jgi:hypothetical protein